jgi:hypothetical protein
MTDIVMQPASFRDPDGHIFSEGGVFYRQVNRSYQATYDRLVQSGLFAKLWAEGLLLEHDELKPKAGTEAYRVLLPRQIATITYPYEWCFSQLKDAALLTLRIQRLAVDAGFSLKDASAYNIQLYEGRLVFIDTLSFEPLIEGRPWAAYRQFCQHFLAPLALMAKIDARLSLFSREFIDGVPLDLASRLLPARTWLNLGLLLHVHLHAKAQRRFINREKKVAPRPITKQGLLGILANLELTVRGLQWKPAGTEWGDYYNITNYAAEARDDKVQAVDAFIGESGAKSVWDMGANDGTYSRLAVARGLPTIAWDIDPVAVEKNYRRMRAEKLSLLVPAVVDLTNPSPSIGWNLEERMSLFERPRPDVALALALIHHLAIGNNLPLGHCAAFFARIAHQLIIEWVPKEDSKVQELLQNREDIFDDYTTDGFERAFGCHFVIAESRKIRGSKRTLYRMVKR